MRGLQRMDQPTLALADPCQRRSLASWRGAASAPGPRADERFFEDLRAPLRSVESLESAVEHLGRHPLTGSSRFAYDLEIPDLRSWPLRRVPYLLFYVDADEHVDVWRIIHARRDVPAWFRGPDEQS